MKAQTLTYDLKAKTKGFGYRLKVGTFLINQIARLMSLRVEIEITQRDK